MAAANIGIGAVSDMLGIPQPTLRSWERRYGFPVPHTTDGRHRRYSREDVALLRLIRDEIAMGHPAREAVRRVRNGQGRQRSSALADRIRLAATQIQPVAIRSVLDDATELVGVEAAIRDVAMPVLRRMGDDWKAGVCDVAHEHVATDGIRSWLARSAERAPSPFRSGSIVLACGVGDLHTLGLEAFAVILRRRGWATVMLGSVPPTSLAGAVRTAAARAVVVSSQQGVTRRASVATLRAAASIRDRRLHVFYAGNAFAAPSARRGVPGRFLGEDICLAAQVLERELA